MSLDISIAIPTYNGAKRLPKILHSLIKQQQIAELQWEIIIIDNNSQDETHQIIKTYQQNWNNPFNLKYYLEPRQGAAFARQKAIQESHADLIGFLDDDNIPAPNWVITAYQFALSYPQAGAFSGQIHGVYEVPPPINFDQIEPFLAIRQHGTKAYRFQASNLELPPGAGLVIRKKAWQESVPTTQIFPGRLGKSMVGGEDLEILIYLHLKKWEIWYNPELHSYHQIPKSRLEPEYLLKLSQACGIPTYHLLTINKNWKEKITITIRIILGNTRRIILHLIKHRQASFNNLILACKLQFYYGCLLSPLYKIIK